MSRSSAELDQHIETSRRSRVAQAVTQMGGVIAGGYAAYKLGTSSGEGFWESAVASLGLSGYGIRLGIERGSAIRRNKDREDGKAMGVEPIGLTETEKELGAQSGVRAVGIAGALGANGFAILTGIQESYKDVFGNYDAFWLPLEVTIPLTGAAAILGYKATEEAGKTYDTYPSLHRLAHL